MKIRYTLLAEGTSDRALMPIIDWLVTTNSPAATSADGQFADLPADRREERGLRDKIACALDLFPCDLLIIHRDADRERPNTRFTEIAGAWGEAAAAQSRTHYVPMVPVRMTEAWLLFDEAAIRKAAGNPSGTVHLDLPRPTDCERIADPKERLFACLRTASELSGRRQKQFNPRTARRRITDYVDDFTPLRRLRSFQQAERDLTTALNRLLRTA